MITDLRVLLFDANLSSPTLVDDLTQSVEDLSFATGLHGGFKKCTFTLASTIGTAWQYLAEAGKTPGRHFFRLVIYEEQNLIWEGRLTDIILTMSMGAVGLRITALGYWASLRDEYYSDDTAGNTDWTSGSGHQASDIIKEILTKSCPSISTDQTNITDNTRDLAGIDLSTTQYPQDIIVNKLAPLSDSGNEKFFFAIWDDRIPYWSARSIATLDYRVRLQDTANLELNQSAMMLRNKITPLVDGTPGTEVTDTTSASFYPDREMLFELPKGSTSAAAADAATTFSAERGFPQQVQQFTISGSIFTSATGDSGADLVEVPKWRVRAGQTIRIDDLVPQTVATPEFDRLRTFHITQTTYDAQTDTLNIYPDTSPRTLGTILKQFGETEAPR